MQIGDIIIAQQILHHDVDTTAFGYAKGQIPKMPTTFDPHPDLIEIAAGLGESLNEMNIYIGLLASGDVFLNSKQKAKALRSDYPGLLAVEMESAAIAQTCYQLGIPYFIFRSISDLANEESHTDFKHNLHIAATNSAAAVLALLDNLAKENLWKKFQAL